MLCVDADFAYLCPLKHNKSKDMRKSFVTALGAVMLVSSCGTYTGSGAYAGLSIGSVLGSAIGGLSDGPRGSDIGTIVGMASGAAIGAAIGNAADRQRQSDLDQYQRDKADRAARREARRRQQSQTQQPAQPQTPPPQADDGSYGSGFDETNSGDDRIYDFSSSDYTGDYSAQKPTTTVPAKSSVEKIRDGLSFTSAVEIRNARFVDANEDGSISRGELCKVIFEVINRSSKPITDVQPLVVEANHNKHIFVSPSIHVERIDPGKGIRYTALVKADNRLKPGTAKICVSVLQGEDKVISKVSEFNIPTRAD